MATYLSGSNIEDDQIEICNTDRKAIVTFRDFYNWAADQCLHEEELRTYHYPRAHSSVLGKAVIHNLPHRYFRSVISPHHRLCRFCFRKYDVDENGIEIGFNTCYYHPYRRPPPSSNYLCCGRARMGRPCSRRNFHSTEDIDVHKLDNFLNSKDVPNSSRAIYALDCEFVQMRKGLALAQIIMVDHNEKVVMNSIVMPPEPIVDYLPQFSNLSEEDFRDNFLTESEFHREMTKFLGPNVILIGHSLHCDLLKMKVIHDNVIDTSRLFKHPDGPQYVLGLKSLAAKYLVGHDFSPSINAPKPQQDSIMAYRLIKNYGLACNFQTSVKF